MEEEIGLEPMIRGSKPLALTILATPLGFGRATEDRTPIIW